ncbi:hypothetical protein KPL78_12185 [Roseomonas sp. HJA6]|uniref:Uncharacterized protein n=1 Tax=Roseomonas alba TaxID=2846776 RepID=A0ABS7ABR0_9PROT|nr:hypothetical protein [Neoroseomonas alba]
MTAASPGRLPLVMAGLLALPLPAVAGQEPRGQTMTGLRVTQDIVNGRALGRVCSPGPTAGANTRIRQGGDGRMNARAGTWAGAGPA